MFLLKDISKFSNFIYLALDFKCTCFVGKIYDFMYLFKRWRNIRSSHFIWKLSIWHRYHGYLDNCEHDAIPLVIEVQSTLCNSRTIPVVSFRDLRHGKYPRSVARLKVPMSASNWYLEMHALQSSLRPPQDIRFDISNSLVDIPRILLLVDTLGDEYRYESGR